MPLAPRPSHSSRLQPSLRLPAAAPRRPREAMPLSLAENVVRCVPPSRSSAAPLTALPRWAPGRRIRHVLFSAWPWAGHSKCDKVLRSAFLNTQTLTQKRSFPFSSSTFSFSFTFQRFVTSHTDRSERAERARETCPPYRIQNALRPQPSQALRCGVRRLGAAMDAAPGSTSYACAGAGRNDLCIYQTHIRLSISLFSCVTSSRCRLPISLFSCETSSR
jgi:hypothetical protein